jgi:hypothetical protein
MKNVGWNGWLFCRNDYFFVCTVYDLVEVGLSRTLALDIFYQVPNGGGKISFLNTVNPSHALLRQLSAHLYTDVKQYISVRFFEKNTP